jgi:hypothetical protein
MSALHSLLRLLVVTLSLLWAAPAASAAVRVGLLSEPRLRAIEELCLVGLQAEPGLEFLERSQLSLLAEELSLNQVLDRAGWSACDALVLFNTFSDGTHAESFLIVRIVSTRDLQVLGLWVYPLLKQSPEKIAERITPRLGQTLTRTHDGGPRTVVSLSLLRADEPRLTALAEPVTYQLAASLAAHPGVALIERWNVRDPAFEQWLRKTQPADIRPPDILVGGALADLDGSPGLRLDINDAEASFTAPAAGAAPPDKLHSASTLAPALVAATRAIAGKPSASPPPAEQEIRRHEQDARWFWKWSAYTQAAAAAETALYLGSKNSETAYIRALANLRPRRGYASNLPYTDTPDAETLSRALHGLDSLLRLPEPGKSAPLQARLPHLRYLEHAVVWTGGLLQGLYLSRETLPGTPGERAELRRLAAELTERAWAYYQANLFPPNSYAPTLDHIDGYGVNLALPVALLDYAAFSVPDAARLSTLYAACLEDVARRQSDNDNILTQLANNRLGNLAWFVDWDGRGVAPAERAQAQATLLQHPKPAVRLLAGLLPLLRRPSEHPQYKPLLAAWLSDLAHRWTADREFFLTKQPPSLPRTLLSYSGLLLAEQQSVLGSDFPAAEWHRFYALLAADAPARLSSQQDPSLRNLIPYLEAESAGWLARNGAARSETAALPEERRARTYALLLEARPPHTDAARSAASEAAAPRREAWRARVAAEEAARPSPRLVFDTTARALVRVTDPDGGPADRLDFAGPSALPISATVAEDGRIWLLFHRSGTLVWRELDPHATTLLREVRLEHAQDSFFNATHHVLGARSGKLYTALRSGLLIIDLEARSSRTAEIQKLRGGRVWLGADQVWLSGEPGLIYEYLPATGALSLVSSAMRSPAQNRLDAREAYEVSAIFEHGGKRFAWIDDNFLHEWDPAARDWREIYSTRSHWSANQRYPADLLFTAVGSGLSAGRSQEGLFRVLGSDPVLNGRFGGQFTSHYASDELPQNWRSAAYLDQRVWTLHADYQGSFLVSKRRGSGRIERFPLGKPVFSGLHAFDHGFLLVNEAAKALHHVPRERIDPGYAPAKPATATTPTTPGTAALGL